MNKEKKENKIRCSSRKIRKQRDQNVCGGYTWKDYKENEVEIIIVDKETNNGTEDNSNNKETENPKDGQLREYWKMVLRKRTNSTLKAKKITKRGWESPVEEIKKQSRETSVHTSEGGNECLTLKTQNLSYDLDRWVLMKTAQTSRVFSPIRFGNILSIGGRCFFPHPYGRKKFN
ncbi:unnamed protein product [Lepeophtheirus salmonis]|uniref:(salmon louse) hypothetical protein n=1 Tax=Lepeophtheirus salmonis TaxID=72036 RepID=A0A7R8D168_LEPSM|nr:unnamed protein product [Lepeophtheirus salmonis]CAF2992453.1 unnamed protein product [Lepeophtheirus salmonis]